MAISPGGEEAGGGGRRHRRRKTEKLPWFRVCVRLLFNHRGFRKSSSIHQKISVVTNYLVGVNAKKPKKTITIKTVSHGDSGAVLDSSAQPQMIKKKKKNTKKPPTEK